MGLTGRRSLRLQNASGMDESAAVFLPDNRILITCRVEVEVDSVFGDVNAGTIIAVAAPPYTQWNCTLDKITRLDGPNLFSLFDSSTQYYPSFCARAFPTRSGFCVHTPGKCLQSKILPRYLNLQIFLECQN